MGSCNPQERTIRPGWDLVTVRRGRLVCGDRPVVLRGVNLGGWLMMEGYLLGGPNVPVRRLRRRWTARHGAASWAEFERDFQEAFIRSNDVSRIASWGFNCLRVPFHHRIVEERPFRIRREGLHRLDRLIRWARRAGVWVILDLHAAPGAQNHDWHSDSTGEAGLWDRPACRERTVWLWEVLARRYRGETAVAGFDLLNEPIPGDPRRLVGFYRRLIDRIRTIDPDRVLFIEGDRWATDLSGLEGISGDGLVLSVHFYEPLDFTFHFVPLLRYPGEEGRNTLLEMRFARYARIAEKAGMPVLLGEFGLNARGGHFGETAWLTGVLDACRRYGFHWIHWTYKGVKNATFPDGILSLRANPPWVRRQGPRRGWETYEECWPRRRCAMRRSWRSEAFAVNPEILGPLREACARR